MQTEECIYYDFGSFCDYSKKQLLILESKEAFFKAYLVTIFKALVLNLTNIGGHWYFW